MSQLEYLMIDGIRHFTPEPRESITYHVSIVCPRAGKSYDFWQDCIEKYVHMSLKMWLQSHINMRGGI